MNTPGGNTMFLTEQEIKDTPAALERTCSLFHQEKKTIKEFFCRNQERKFIFLGCGSSYMLAKSAAAIFGAIPNTTAYAIPAGDYIVNSDFWEETVKGSIVVSISRSGRTSEMVLAIKKIKAHWNCPVISLSMEDNNDIMPMSNLNLTMHWCYDRSVCQTRTVTNLYAALLLLAAAYSGDDVIEASVEKAASECARFQEENLPVLEEISKLPWNNVTVLADGPVCGIAEEAALAFTEIAMLPGRYFHVLDYRHGPIVLSDVHTLTLILISPMEANLQKDMIRDVLSHNGPVVTIAASDDCYNSTTHIKMPQIKSFAAWGILFIYVAQMTALLKCLELAGNPDAPVGLDAYITLK